MKQHHAKGHTAKHTSTAKHSGTKKHNPGKHHQGHATKGPKTSPGPLVVAQHPKHPKARKLAVGTAWPCCSAEALGASLRLAGWPVGDEDVLALHVAAGGSEDRGVPILAALQTAARCGLAGVRPRGFRPRPLLNAIGSGYPSPGRTPGTDGAAVLILGTDLPAGWYSPEPGPHALVLDGPGVWSWGAWHPWGCFGGAEVDEVWRVVWP